MQFQTTPDNLLTGISTVQRAVAHKSPLAVLSGILFEIQQHAVTLTGSNMDLTISRTIPASETVPGETVLPARELAEIVRRLPDLPVTVTVDPDTNSAELHWGRARARLNGYDPAEFPRPAAPRVETGFSAERDVFHGLFKRVIYAVGQDELRPIFTGVLVEIDGGEVRAVATDTHRLAFNRAEFAGAGGEQRTAVISGRALSELVRILGQADEETFGFALAENHVTFTIGPTKLTSRVIVGNYPDYRRVIPSVYQSRIRGVEAPQLLRAVERAATLAHDASPVVTLQLEGETLSITAESQTGSIREEVPVCLEGEPLEVSFNARYLEDALRWCETAKLNVEFNGPVGPALFRPLRPGDEYLALVLPVRLF